MWALLALIGLLFILYWASKGFTRLGNFLIHLSDELGDYAVTIQKKGRRAPKSKASKEITDKMRIIKGEDTDDDYEKKVRQEIEELTDPDS